MSEDKEGKYGQQCRLCTSKEEGHLKIFDSDGLVKNLSNKIKECLPVIVTEEDHLPKWICLLCVETLEQFHEFRQACVRAEIVLENNLKERQQQHAPCHNTEAKIQQQTVFPTDPEAKIQQQTVFPTDPETKIQQQTVFPMDPETKIQQQTVFPTDPEAKIQQQTVFPTDPEAKIQQQTVFPTDPEAKIQQQTVFPTDPEAKIQQQTVFPTDPEAKIQQQTVFPTDPETKIQQQTVFPLDPETKIQQQTVFPLDPETKIQQQTVFPLDPETKIQQQTVFPLDPETKIQQQTVFPLEPECCLQEVEPDVLIKTISRSCQMSGGSIISTSSHVPHIRGLTIIPFSSSNNQQDETRTDTRLGVPSPEDYVLMKEETFAVDSDRLGTQHIEACVAALQDSDVVRALKRRREVLPPMWDVFERRSAPGKRALVTQRRYIVNKGAFPCSLCNKCFTVTQGYTRDGLGDPNDGLSGEEDASLPFATVRFFSCHVCGKVFPKRSSLKRHQRVHLELFSPGPLAPHPCPLCGKAFGRREHLSRHLASHANTRQYACDNCSKPFLRKEHLERHRLAHCRGSHEELELPESEHPTTPPPVEDLPVIDRPFPCDVCQQTFVGQDQLERHQKRMHNMIPLEGSTVKPRIHTCSVCSRVFTRKEHMVRHQKIHQREFLLGSGSFLADMTLTVPTNSAAALNNNNNDSLAETGIKLEGTSWNDDSLSKVYNGQDLNHHLDDIKSEPDDSSSPTQEQVKPYQCPCCEAKTFTRRSHMVRHFKRAHSDQPLSLVVISNRTDYSRQYKEFQLSNGQHYCKFCGKTFGRRYHLVRHMKVHGSNDAPQPFHCSSCDNSFSSHDLFQSHICQEAVSKKDDCIPQGEKRRRTRGGYHECGVCGINFAKKKLLKRHSLTVHGPHP